MKSKSFFFVRFFQVAGFQLLLILILCFVLSVWVTSVLANPTSTIVVDTTSDLLDAAANCTSVTLASLPGTDGYVSLREAICAANNNAGADTIEFNIFAALDPGCNAVIGLCTIEPGSYLPILTDDATTIDGYTQSSASPATDTTPATIRIEIDGTGIANNGLNVTSSSNIIRGLSIYGFAVNGIWVANYDGRIANNNVIAGNYLGLDARDLLCLGNGYNGIFVGMGAQNNLIGGDIPADRNLIACNGLEGVGIHGSGTSGNVVSGNYIGTEATGTLPRANSEQGVRIYGGAQTNTIGGDTAGERNLISGNAGEGILLTGVGTNNNTVSGNYIGTNLNGIGIVPNMSSGIVIEGGAQGNVIGGSNTTPGGPCSGQCNLISGNTSAGVRIMNPDTDNNLVSGNYIGTNVSGTVNLDNYNGIIIGDGASQNLIGGDTPAERNLISGNEGYGVYIYDVTRSNAVSAPKNVLAPAATQGNTISGNYIGTDVSGTFAIPNGIYGASIGGQAESNTITDNLISGNTQRGISIQFSDNNLVTGNYVGTNAAGTAALGNGEVGLYLGNYAQGNIIGGDTGTERNLISGNNEVGVILTGGNNTTNVLSGNYIGVDITGAADLGNFHHALVIENGAHDNIIGGDSPGERNIISGSGNYGVAIFDADTDNNQVVGNFIGTDASGNTDIGNGGFGIIIIDGPENNIVGPDNRIAYNSHGGVQISGSDSTGNVITQNSIYANEMFGGIDLAAGANNDMPVPTILFTHLGSVIIQGAALPGSTVEVFASPTDEGQGQIYLGSTVAESVGSYTLELPSLPYPYLTATATDPADGTSEFSEVFTSTVYQCFLPLVLH
jgi:titin